MSGLFDGVEVWHEDKRGMEKVIVDYFSKLFYSQGSADISNILRVINPRVSADMNHELLRPVPNEEVKEALFQMHPTKTPRPDGMSPGFYQKHWKTVGQDVCDGVRHVLMSGHLLRKINYTHVTLIPKKSDPTEMTHLRPISLCNVIYKICSKVLTNRLKAIFPDIISPSQSAFIPGRLISDNCMVASEIAHYMHWKNNGWKVLWL